MCFPGKKSGCQAGNVGSIPNWEDTLEDDMTTHSCILACEIPWTEESGGLQFISLQGV